MEPSDAEPGVTPEILESWSQMNVAGVPAEDMVEYRKTRDQELCTRDVEPPVSPAWRSDGPFMKPSLMSRNGVSRQITPSSWRYVSQLSV